MNQMVYELICILPREEKLCVNIIYGQMPGYTIVLRVHSFILFTIIMRILEVVNYQKLLLFKFVNYIVKS